MKKIAIIFISLLSYAVASAQSSVVQSDTVKVIDQDKYRVLSNRFWQNWFVGAGAGVQTYFGDHNKQTSLGDNLAPNFAAYVGKWFSPGFGVRAGASGRTIKGLTQNHSHTTGEVYDAKERLEYQKFNYFHIHGDVLFNLSNIIAGYKEDRFYNLIPYLGVGWMWTEDDKYPQQRELSANFGILNTFRLSNALDLTLDVRGSMVNDRFDGEVGKRRNEGPLSALIGLKYNFPKRGWDKQTYTTVTNQYDDAALAALRQQVKQLSADNTALAKQLADAKNNTITDIQVQNSILVAPILVTFPINEAVVSNEARVNLGFFAQTIIEGKSNVVYNVTGYADNNTGSATTNERLSKARAQAIYDILVKEYAVPAKQLRIAYKGGVGNMFYNDPKLSRAVITIAESK